MMKRTFSFQKSPMNSLFKLVFFIVLIFHSFLPVFAMDSIRGLDGFEWQKIDAVKNARNHSNMGNIYFQQENYISALKEYQIAYNLTYDSGASSTYLYNISQCFMKLNNYIAAKSAIEGAIEKNCMNMTYYKTLVDIYIKLNIQDKELYNHLQNLENPYNRLITGLIYLKTGSIYKAKSVFDEFIYLYPDMIITDDVKSILRTLN